MRVIRASALLPALVAAGAIGAEPVPAPTPDGAALATHHVAPEYPPKALEQRVDGCVLLSFRVDAEGRGSDFQVLDSQPKGVFDAATLKVMDQWRFRPPAREGRYAQLVQFRLDKQAAVNQCQPLPTFAALNPDAPPPTRRVRVLETVMPQFKGVPGAAEGGCVTVRFQIKHDGFVGDVVLEARPEAMGPPAVAALKQWHFESFPPPAVVATQTFQYTPETMKMPETMIRAPYLDIADGGLRSVGCGKRPDPDKAAEPAGAKG
jgi:TonB family protein